MMTAAAYVSQVVEPTLEEFRRDRHDLRRAMLASMVVAHVIDFIAQNQAAEAKGATKASVQAGNDAAEAFRAKAAAKGTIFAAANLFALAAKHGRPKRQPDFDTDRHRVMTPAFYGHAHIGHAFIGDTTGGFTIDLGEGAHLNLLNALDATMALYRAEFPEAFMAGTSAQPSCV